MKKLVFSILMCVAAMSAKAQVLTFEIVNNIYEAVSNQSDGDFFFNADKNGRDITTMYVFKKVCNTKGIVTLMPHRKYDYTYATDGTLTSRIVYHWSESMNNWTSAARYDFTLVNGKYNTEYSRYNPLAQAFDQPVEKMVYTLLSDDSTDYVCCYHRNCPSSPFQLVSETYIGGEPLLMAKK